MGQLCGLQGRLAMICEVCGKPKGWPCMAEWVRTYRCPTCRRSIDNCFCDMPVVV